VGVHAIAATLGISKKTLYRHFPSRDDLVIGHLRGRFRPLPEAFTKPPVEQILANLEWIARFPDQRQGLPRLRVSQRTRRAR
jgi:AcrR family transcriptional regulator